MFDVGKPRGRNRRKRLNSSRLRRLRLLRWRLGIGRARLELPQSLEREFLRPRMHLHPAVRVVDKDPDGQGMLLGSLDNHRDLPRLGEHAMKKRARVFRKAQIVAADGLIPSHGNQPCRLGAFN